MPAYQLLEYFASLYYLDRCSVQKERLKSSVISNISNNRSTQFISLEPWSHQGGCPSTFRMEHVEPAFPI